MPRECEDFGCYSQGVEIQAMAGSGGWRLAAGHTGIGFPFWADLLGTVTRTRSAPRGASAESTYVGVEGGFAFPAYMNDRVYVSVRPSIGVARRVQGTGTSADRTTFTWTIGAYLMLPKY